MAVQARLLLLYYSPCHVGGGSRDNPQTGSGVRNVPGKLAASQSAVFNLKSLYDLWCKKPPLCAKANETQAHIKKDIFVCPLPQMLAH